MYLLPLFFCQRWETSHPHPTLLSSRSYFLKLFCPSVRPTLCHLTFLSLGMYIVDWGRIRKWYACYWPHSHVSKGCSFLARLYITLMKLTRSSRLQVQMWCGENEKASSKMGKVDQVTDLWGHACWVSCVDSIF